MPPLSLFSWNVNGLRAIERKNALEWFYERRPDILCLQETKAQPEQLSDSLREIDGYHSFFCSAERKGYSGVAVYSKAEPKRVTCGFGVDEFDIEGRTLIAEFDGFSLYNVYFPNGKASAERLAYKMAFYEAFLAHINRRKRRGAKIVICGDVNTAHKAIDLARPKENEKVSGFLPEERAWMDKLVADGYVDTLRLFNDKPDQYTWWDMKSRARERNVGWRIDYFFVSENLRDQVTGAGIHPDIMGSDHCPVAIDLNA